MQIAFHGAAQTVTGSRHLIEVNGSRLLLDCGLYQGRRKDAFERNLNFPFEPGSVDAVILSHAHIDHSGNIPNLVRQGYGGLIYATHASVRLTDVMTRDSGHIQESDVHYLNKKRARRGEPPVEPLYTAEDAARACRQLTGVDYNEAFEPVPGVTARLVEAGHILGSAGVALDIEENGRKVKLMFSGDIGRLGLPLVRDPVLPDQVDVLIMESTYGSSTHQSAAEAYEALRSVVAETADRGGKVIIPAFAVGRTQALVFYLHQMIERREIAPLPVFVDSPLAINVTAVFREHRDCFDAETQRFIQADPHGAALGFDRLDYTLSVEESKAINRVDGPAVIISASGMAENGRILHHLANGLEDERNTVLITSWMAPHTLGRRLLEGEPRVRIFGDEFNVRARVASMDGLSAHADQGFLVTYAGGNSGPPGRVFLVHGEPSPARALMEKLEQAGIEGVAYPALGDRVEV